MQKTTKLIIAVIFICSLLMIGNSRNLMAYQQDDDKPNPQWEESYARLREGYGQIKFAKSGDSLATVQASIQSMAEFLEARSGIKINTQTREKLAQLELKALTDHKGITADNLEQMFINTAFQRLSIMSDDEIDNMVDILRGPINPNSLPEKSRTRLFPRASIGITYKTGEIETQLKTLRDPKAQLAVSVPLKKYIHSQMHAGLRNLAAAMPVLFSKDQPITPMKAFIFAYSFAADDEMYDNLSNLQQGMNDIYAYYAKAYSNYPKPAGFTAFGSNGYLYASPINYFFDENVQRSILNSIATQIN